MRYYETFYGIDTDDWKETFADPVFVDHTLLLTKEYISDGCATTDWSFANGTHKFLYPQHIKKTYFIEGVITGHITVGTYDSASTIVSYRVTVCKVNSDTTETELFTTGWVTLNDALTWDAGLGVGEERVYPFWIDAWQQQKLGEFDRIYVKVEFTAYANIIFWHSNDATWEDLKIEIPFVM